MKDDHANQQYPSLKSRNLAFCRKFFRRQQLFVDNRFPSFYAHFHLRSRKRQEKLVVKHEQCIWFHRS